jgi:hypothetical protein
MDTNNDRIFLGDQFITAEHNFSYSEVMGLVTYK